MNEGPEDREEGAAILKLNDDCLFEIFKKVPSLDDRINFAKANDRFRNVFKTMEKHDTIYLCQDQFSDKKKLQNFLDCFAPDIQTLSGHGSQVDCLEMITESCINLTKVEIWGKIKTDNMLKLSNATKVKELVLIGCDLLDHHMLEINLPNVESLDLSGNSSLTGEHLSKFKKIQHLKMISCSNIEEKSFVAIFSANPQLRSLDATECTFFKDEAVDTFVSNCKQIETLTVEDGLHDRNVTDEMLNKLTDLKYLSKLNISFSHHFTAQGLSNFLKNGPQLKNLSIIYCHQLNRDFLLKVFEALKSRLAQNERSKIVTTLEKDEQILELFRDDPQVNVTFVG